MRGGAEKPPKSSTLGRPEATREARGLGWQSHLGGELGI